MNLRINRVSQGAARRAGGAAARTAGLPGRLRPLAACVAGALALAAGPAAWGQAPDGGRILDSLRDRPGAPAAPATPAPPRPEIDAPAAEIPPVAPGGPTVQVTGFEFSGNTVISNSTLQTELFSYVGRNADFAALTEAAARITRLYRARGYLVARAVLPPQAPADGRVRITISEGLLGEVKVERARGLRLTQEAIDNFLRGLDRGAPIREDQLERSLLLLAEVDGARVRAALTPGSAPGTADLVVRVTEGPVADARAELDNYGSRVTGPWRTTARLGLHDYFGHGENFELRATSTFEGLNATSLAASAPFMGSGVRLGAYLTRVEYRIGRDLAQLAANGNATIGGAYLSYALLKGRNASISARAGLESRRFMDRIEQTGMVTSKKSEYASLGLSGEWNDVLLGGARNTWSLRAGHGVLRRYSETDAAFDAITANTAGKFSKSEFSYAREQRLVAGFSLYGAVSGQRASRNLDSTEKFYLGGPFGVRAYPQGEAAGDEGTLGTLELRRAFAGPGGSRLQGMLFVDSGQARLNKNPWDPAQTANYRNLRGSGVGLTWTMNRAASLSVGLAWRHGGAPTVEMDRAPRMWMQLSLAPQALAGVAALPGLGMEGYAGTRAEIYGTIGMMVERVGREHATAIAPRIATQALTPTGQNVPTYTRVRDTVSYIGLRGAVPLGQGPEVFYQLESSLSYAWNSDGTLESAVPSSSISTALRESAIGVRSPAWGSVLFGQWDMPIKEAFSGFDPFGGDSLASNYNVIGSPGFGVSLMTGNGPSSFTTDANNDDSTFNRRQGGVIQYWSPEIAGLSVRAAYSNSRRRAAPDVDFGRVWGLSAVYKTGGLTLAVGYERHDNYFGIASLGRNNRGVGSASANTAGTSSVDYSWRVGAQYKFGATEVAVIADNLVYREFGVAPFNVTPDLSRYQRTAWVVNLTHHIGAWELRSGYGQASAGSCEVIVSDPTQNLCTTNGLGARFLSLGFSYAWRKDTSIFGHFSRLDNNPSSSYNFGTGGVFAGAGRAAGVGSDLYGYGVGVKYKF